MQTAEESSSQRILAFLESSSLEPGTLFTMADLSEAAGVQLHNRRKPLYVAIRRLEEKHNRTMICETNKGYRIAHPNETCDVIQVRVKRADGQFKRGQHTGRHTDLALLDQNERQKLHQLQGSLNMLRREVRQVRGRVDAVEDRVERIEATAISRDAEIEALVEAKVKELLGQR